MSDEGRTAGFLGAAAPKQGFGGVPHSLFSPNSTQKDREIASCELDAEGHCVTCSDEALSAKVLSIDEETGLALVEVKDTTEEIDITLVDSVSPGDMLLVHGGVAIASMGAQGVLPLAGGSEVSPEHLLSLDTRMGVQGALPLAGGSGVTHEHLLSLDAKVDDEK